MATGTVSKHTDSEVVIESLKFGTDGSGNDVVIVTGDFTDNTDSGYGKGSLGLDTTNGLLFVSDNAGKWQQVTV